jgi:putative molybdopterin biosynthesis protein
MTVAEAAEYLRIGRHTLYRLVESGRIPSYRIGRKILLDLQDLDDILRNGSLASR